MVQAHKHPATFTNWLLPVFEEIVRRYTPGDSSVRVLDPFAGTGKVHQLPFDTLGIEIEPEWAAQHPNTIYGDSTRLLTWLDPVFDAVVTSPAYGNRMADKYLGDSKGSRRYTYATALGRHLRDNNGAGMRWGQEYRDLHEKVWRQCYKVLRPGGIIVVNVKNHIRDGKTVDVVGWHLETLQDTVGFQFLAHYDAPCPGQRHGANRHLRVDNEEILVLRRPITKPTLPTERRPT